MRSALPVLIAVALLAATAVGHGLRTNRWGRAKELAEAGRPLERLPRELGDWSGTDVEISAREMEIADAAGYLCRNYVHRPTGRRAMILIIYGRPGPIGSHTPDVCYRGAGFVLTPQTTRRAVKHQSGTAQFHTTTATKEGPRPEALSVWWSMSRDLALWEAPSVSRVHFAFTPVLYKVYLVRPLDSPRQADSEEHVKLSEQFLAQVFRSLK